MIPETHTVSLHSLSLGYGRRLLLEDVSAGFTGGQFTALIGRNGTGKSTLLRTMAGLSKPLSGYVSVEGVRLDDMTRRQIASCISFVSTDDVRSSGLKAGDIVALGRSPYTNWAGSLSAGDKAKVNESLELVGMTRFAEKSVDQLSDGERQRVMIARALAQDTPIILLDEPTAFLDLPNKYEICLLLGRLAHEQGKCIVTSTHDLGIALELCDTIAIIDGQKVIHAPTGQLVSDGSIQGIFDGTSLVFDPLSRSVKLK